MVYYYILNSITKKEYCKNLFSTLLHKYLHHILGLPLDLWLFTEMFAHPWMR